MSAATPWRPTRAQLAAARTRTVRDLIAPELRVLFVGINPGLYSAAVGHHFGRPGNRFWPALHRAGFTTRLLSPFDERELLATGVGITNIVARTTASAAELTPDELRRGARRLARKVGRHRPAIVAFLGLGAYRIAVDDPRARLGPQPERFAGARAWLLPNPSGLNAHHQLPDLARRFAALRRAAGLDVRRRPRRGSATRAAVGD
jgi:TDG/mug DNA glycosylase family protein